MASESPWPAAFFHWFKPESVHVFVHNGSSKVMVIHGMGMDSLLRKDSSDCCQLVLVCFFGTCRYVGCATIASEFWFFPGVCEKAMTTSRSCTDSANWPINVASPSLSCTAVKIAFNSASQELNDTHP